MQSSNRRASSDVAILLSILIALPLYGLTLVSAPEMPRSVREVLLDRSWVTHVILLLTFVALTILVVKAVGLVRQRRALRLEILPTQDAITPDNVGMLLQQVDAHRAHFGRTRSFLLERIARVLQHFAARGDVTETTTAHQTESDADANGVASSFNLVKVLVWSMPILGFIGTVIGISKSMAAFSKSLGGAAEFDSVKSSLGNVTTGLALAFDVTLVALVAAILVMLPMSWLAKSEERLLEDVDDYCTSNILRRLSSPREVAATAEASAAAAAVLRPEAVDALRQAIADALGPALREMLSAHTALMTRLSDDREALSASQAALTADREALSASQSALATQLSGFATASRTLAPAVEHALEGLGKATSLLKESTTVAERSAVAAGRAQEQLCRELGASRQLLQLLAAGLASSADRSTSSNGQSAVTREDAE